MPLIGFLIVLNGFFYNIKSPQAMLLIAGGLYKESKVQTTIQGGLMVVLGCILGRCWGIEGVLIASIISNLYRDIDLLVFIPKMVTSLPITSTLKRWASMICCFAVIVFVMKFIPIEVSNYFEWFIYACISGIIAVVVIFLNAILFDRCAFRGLVGRIKAVVKR